MEAEMVHADASAMAKDIAKTGRVAIYDIYFDTDKADLKSESKPTLQEIPELFKQDSTLNLYVVRRAYAVGSCEHNMTFFATASGGGGAGTDFGL